MPHAAPVMMSPMSYQEIKRTHDNNIMPYRCHWLWSLRHDNGVSNDGNDQQTL